MIKKTIAFILGIIALLCLLPWIFGIEQNILAVLLGIVIIIGLFIYLFLGQENPIP